MGSITNSKMQFYKLEKKNKLVVLICRTLYNIDNGDVVGRISEGFRPTEQYWISCVGEDSAGGEIENFGIATFATNGNISVEFHNGTSTFSYAAIFASYFV